MTTKELAALLNGREIGEEITPEENDRARADGLIVIFGGSDDLAEIRGAIDDEIGCYEGGPIYFLRAPARVLPEHEHNECDCPFCGYQEMKDKAVLVQAVWSEGDYSWTYKTAIPHETFDIFEGTEKYCRGIVFHAKDL